MGKKQSNLGVWGERAVFQSHRTLGILLETGGNKKLKLTVLEVDLQKPGALTKGQPNKFGGHVRSRPGAGGVKNPIVHDNGKGTANRLVWGETT